MRRADVEPPERLLTPSKITAWLDCAHYLTLRRLADAGELTPLNEGLGSFARLLMDKGMVHERAYLDRLAAEGRSVFEVPGRATRETFADWTARVAGVLAEGHDVVYQYPMVHDGLRGVADFLVRVPEPSALGAFSYEPVDAKLARAEAKPGHVLQLCFYADALGAAQGRRPRRIHLHLGSGLDETVRLRDVDAYWRRIRDQLRRVVDAAGDPDTTPERCSHCAFCEFADLCEAEWRAQDALHFVAGIRTTDIADLRTVEVTTMAELASRAGNVEGMQPERLTVLRDQARLQRAAAAGQPPPFELLALGEDADPYRTRLPVPDDGDVFLDYEGHPFWTPARGLFFLFGVLSKDPATAEWRYEATWAHNPSGEAHATRELIDWIAARRAVFPAMHVYHYNHTERSALERLAAEHGAGEQELADLLAHGVFVDVFDVVRRRLVVGAESYGLKTLELLAGYERSHDIDRGAGAVVEYDEWCRDGDPGRLARIARYNEDDVRATLAVREWLVGGPLGGDDPRPVIDPDDDSDDTVDDLVAALVATGEDWKVLLGQLLEYWNREGRAHWAQHAALLDTDLADQLAHPEVIAGLEHVGTRPPAGRQRDERAVFRFPPQTLGPDLSDGNKPTLMFPAGSDTIVSVSADAVDVDAGELVVGWSTKAAEAGVYPTAMVLNDWVSPHPKPDALREFAQRAVEGGSDPADPVRVALLRRELPRFRHGRGPVDGRFSPAVVDIVEVAPELDNSYLAIQGPPGTGKTYTGAHIIQRLVADRKRVGVTAFSHAAIDNLLREAARHTPSLRILRQNGPPQDPAAALPNATYNATRAKWDSGEHDVIAGTSWLFARADMRATPAVDVLIIDEAGQMGLADALAAMSSAHNVILLGDPLQLAQVSLAVHPGEAGASVLEHVLGPDQATIPDRHGVFLDTTRRMHHDVCDFLSTHIYDGRLHAHPDCAHQSVGRQTGLRWILADHHGCSTASEEEAALVASTIRSLIGQTWRNAEQAERPLRAEDVMVVAPYNDHVDLLQATFAADPALAAVRVGTVDKFQGQEAPVVLFSMATSTGDDMPRTADFLFSRNRLNVAVSRARALAYVVCTDQLLDARARTVDEMRLIGTLCAFVEASGAQADR
jgi:uncharacterized protein